MSKLVAALFAAVIALSACSPVADEPAEAEQEQVEQTEEVQEEKEEQADESEEVVDEPADETAGVGDSVTVGDYEVVVTDYTDDATESVLSANQFNDDPSHGVYSTVTFDATYNGSESSSPAFDIKAYVVIDGVRYADYECYASIDGKYDAPTLETGGTATVTFCFDNPGGAESLFFEELLSFTNDRTEVRVR